MTSAGNLPSNPESIESSILKENPQPPAFCIILNYFLNMCPLSYRKVQFSLLIKENVFLAIDRKHHRKPQQINMRSSLAQF